MSFDRAHAAGLIRGFIQQKFLPVDQPVVDDDAPLMTSGLVDSFALVDLLQFLEDTFQVDISEADMTPDRMNTVDMIVTHVGGLLDAR